MLDTVPDLILQKVIRPKGVHSHVPTDGDKLWARQIVQCKFILEEFGDFDNVIRGGCIARGADLTGIINKVVRSQ